MEYYKDGRIVHFVVYDTDEQDFPRDEDDLFGRLKKIKEGLPDQGDNMIKFVVPTFILFKDCGFITKENMKFLSNRELDGWQMNPLGGIVRQKGLSMWDKTNLRYYCPKDELIVPSDIEMAKRQAWNGKSKLAVVCENTTYYISNDWFAPEKSRPTKEIFYNFLALHTLSACKEIWQKNNDKIQQVDNEKISEEPEKKMSRENNF